MQMNYHEVNQTPTTMSTMGYNGSSMKSGANIGNSNENDMAKLFEGMKNPILNKEPNKTHLTFKNESYPDTNDSAQSKLNFNLFNNKNSLFFSSENSEEKEDVDFGKQGSGSTTFSSKNNVFNLDNCNDEEKTKSMNYEPDFSIEANLPSSLFKDDDDEDDDSVCDENPLEGQLKTQEENPENLMLLTNLLTLAKEQTTCRYLQQKIEEKPELGWNYFYPTIISHINDLIIHPFGNYLIQKVLDYLSESQRTEILMVIEPNFLVICINFYGTRVIQKFIESIKTEALMRQLVQIVKVTFSSLLKDINGSHIIMKLLSLKELYITSLLYESINANLLEISMHKHGCCVIQKIIENDRALSEKIINSIIQNCSTLITHQYGNYTIQYVLQLKNQSYSRQIIVQILANFAFLAKQKYSSTVIEKSFDLCDEINKRAILQTVGNRQILKDLLLDKFGNYVVQKALDCSDEMTKRFLLSMIAPLISELKRQNFGKQLCNKLYLKYPLLQEITIAMINYQYNQLNQPCPYK